MKPVIWLIGGTSEGRALIKAMADLDVELFVSVATEYESRSNEYTCFV